MLGMSALTTWLILGAVLLLLEFLLPGLVVMFVGLGALTVALGMHLQIINTLFEQLGTWFASSLVYMFTLRVMLVRLYPSDTEKVSIDEIDAAIGAQVEVIERIPNGGHGRIQYNESTWQARMKNAHGKTARVGTFVKIVGRANITWLVE